MVGAYKANDIRTTNMPKVLLLMALVLAVRSCGADQTSNEDLQTRRKLFNFLKLRRSTVRSGRRQFKRPSAAPITVSSSDFSNQPSMQPSIEKSPYESSQPTFMLSSIPTLTTNNPSDDPTTISSNPPSNAPETNKRGECQDLCFQDDDCHQGLKCARKSLAIALYGCIDIDTDAFAVCVQPTNGTLEDFGEQIAEKIPLRRCQGPCTSNMDCANGLRCSSIESAEEVPDCLEAGTDVQGGNFCVEVPPTNLINYSGNPPDHSRPLGLCEGDCDNDRDCEGDLVCYQRDENEEIPGCLDGHLESTKSDYCIPPPPTNPPYYLSTPPEGVVTYHPGNLTTFKDKLLLSEGLDSRLIATGGLPVKYGNEGESSIPFHFRPDAGAVFPDHRPENIGGWVYVSNSEILDKTGSGGVGAITFDGNGTIIDYRMVLEGSNWNCGGGKTPWNTWVSCEESPRGRIFQVDPFGERQGQEMVLGSELGTWESFAYDIRNPSIPRFFATEDNVRGALARYTPSQPDWNNTWDMLHGPGSTDYLFLEPNQDGSNGTFTWTSNRQIAKDNAQRYYPHSEGIDVYKNELFFVCKQIKMLFTLDLDAGTYKRTSTQSGLFDGGPDQLKRILDDDSEESKKSLLFFTEDGGVDSGLHARDKTGKFFTILESPTIPGETTGLAFSPDAKHIYIAYQDVGLLFVIWRRDGFPFDHVQLDIKYHDA